jgi:hypothetical protein
MSISAAIDAIGELGPPFGPPATEAELAALEAALGLPLPADVAALYRHGNGQSRFTPADHAAGPLGEVFRLMDADEAATEHPGLARYRISANGRRAFWTDDQSNLGLVYVEGPLAGRVTILFHDDPDYSPTHRSVASFLLAVARAGRQGHEGVAPFPDYPALAPAPETDAADWEAARVMAERFEGGGDEDEAAQHAYCAIVLTPYERTDTLLAYARHEDMYVQEKACSVLGLRKWEPAVPLLGEIAMRGQVNGRTAATQALGRIGTPAAHRELARVHDTLPDSEVTGVRWLFAKAFADAGCEVDGTGFQATRYREPGGEWKPLTRP